jgi:hypothetical protein
MANSTKKLTHATLSGIFVYKETSLGYMGVKITDTR